MKNRIPNVGYTNAAGEFVPFDNALYLDQASTGAEVAAALGMPAPDTKLASPAEFYGAKSSPGVSQVYAEDREMLRKLYDLGLRSLD